MEIIGQSKNTIETESDQDARLVNFWNTCLALSGEAERLKRFFCRPFDADEYWLFVYMDRRCASLLRLYMRTFGKKEAEIISHSALPGLFHKLRTPRKDGKRILLVDDILVHGRAIKKLWIYLTEACGIPKNQIDIDVYGYCAVHPKCLTDDIRERIIPVRILEQETWRSLSSQMIKLAYESGFPHAAFIVSYGGYMPDEPADLSSLVCDDTIPALKNLESDTLHIVWTPKKYPADALVSKASFRAIYSKITGQLSLIPFVVTYSVLKERLPSLLESLSEALPESCGSLKQALLYSELPPVQDKRYTMASNALAEYHMRLVNCVLSVWFGASFFRTNIDIHVQEILKLDTEILAYSFSKEIALDFEVLEQLISRGQWSWDIGDFVNGTVYEPGAESDFLSEEDKIVFSLLKTAKEENQNEQKWIWDKYFALSGEEDDFRARTGGERLAGLPVGNLKELEDNDMFAHLIECWDRGAAALVYCVKGDICGAFSLAGEQSFQYYLRRYGKQIHDMRNLANQIWYSEGLPNNITEIRRRQHEAMEKYANRCEDTIRDDLLHFLGIYETEIFSWNAGVM